MPRLSHSSGGSDERGRYVEISVAELRRLAEQGITPDELGELLLQAASIETDEQGNVLPKKEPAKKKTKKKPKA